MKFLRVSSLFIAIFLMLSVCGCDNKPADDEVIYEYVYEDASGNTNSFTDNYENNDLANSQNLSSENQETQSNFTNTTLPYTFEEYLHKSITISFNDSYCNTYGFTWNSIGKPINPVLKICKGTSFDEKNCKEIDVNYEKRESYFSEDFSSYYYISKATVSGLEPNTEYTYQICDDGAKVYSVPATFKTSNPNASSFTFLHFSDSQVLGAKDFDGLGTETGISFGNTLSVSTSNCPSTAFLLHTGDIVEWSKYEGYWTNMLDFNKQFFNKFTFMPISGNHETSYRSGKYEIEKHFNITPAAKPIAKGFYYYFDYGNARFIMLNTNDLSSEKLKDDQLIWLKQLLSTNPKKWTIVSMHNPMYSPGQWGGDPKYNSISLALRNQLSKLFAEHNVDLVLQGHDHCYSWTYPIDQNGNAIKTAQTETIDLITHYVKPNGTIYAEHGTSGNQTRGPDNDDPLEYYSVAKRSNPNSWSEISVDNDKITVKVYYALNGSAILYDSYGITK